MAESDGLGDDHAEPARRSAEDDPEDTIRTRTRMDESSWTRISRKRSIMPAQGRSLSLLDPIRQRIGYSMSE